MLLNHSLRRLGHPLTIAMLGLLLLNDHVLRHVWPSWWTGKLGDVAWLFAAPIALAVVLSAIVGRLPVRQSAAVRLTCVLTWGSIGLIFVLTKTAPAVHEWVVAAASVVFGFPVGWRLDPTDLLALPALVLSGMWWLRTHAPVTRWPERGWLVLPFAALLTIANSPAPDPGIFCLSATEDTLHSFSAYAAFTSRDGGLTWQEGGPGPGERSCSQPWGKEGQATVSDPDRPDVQYRYTPGQSIEMSTDRGATWQISYAYRPASEAEVSLIQRSLTGYRAWRDGPLDAVVDPATGNAVFAMGNLGVLVRTADGAWTWVGVGPNYRIRMDTPEDVASLLSGQLFLSLALALLALGTLSMRLGQGGPLPILIILAWLLWPPCVFLFSPEVAYGYGLLFTWLGMAGLGVLLLPAAVISILRLAQAPRPVAQRVTTVATGAGLLFLLPFVLWAINSLPHYWWAAGSAVILGIGTLIVGARWIRE